MTTYILSAKIGVETPTLFKFVDDLGFIYSNHEWKQTNYQARLITEQEALEFIAKLKLESL